MKIAYNHKKEFLTKKSGDINKLKFNNLYLRAKSLIKFAVEYLLF